MQIIDSQGLVVNNITVLGSSETGASSSFNIVPQDNNLIAASQFSIEQETLNNIPEVSNVTFSDSIEPYSSGNTVIVSVQWNGTTTLNDDYNLNLNINFDDTTNFAYDSIYTQLDINLIPLIQSGSSATVSIDAAQNGIPNFSVNSYGIDMTTYVISCDITTNNQIAIANVTYTVSEGANSGEGYRFFNIQDPTNLEDVFDVLIGDSEGGIEFNTIGVAYDDFANVYSITKQILYTRQQGVTEDSCEINTTSSTTDYLTTFLASYNASPDGEDEFAVSFTSNIPEVVTQWSITYTGDGGVSDGSTTTSYANNGNTSYYVDVTELPGGTASRTTTLTLKDSQYNIVRATTTITQQAAQFITLQLANISGNNVVTNLASSAGKVISTPNGLLSDNQFGIFNNAAPYSGGGGNVFEFNIPQGGNRVDYALRVTTDVTVNANQITDDILDFAQVTYPLNADGGSISPASNWVMFEDVAWTELGNNSYMKRIRIRNQDRYDYLGNEIVNDTDQNLDRTATITATHPVTGSTSAVTITQDKRYNTADIAQAQIIRPAGNEGTDAEWTAAAALSSSPAQFNVAATQYESQAGVYEIKLKFGDFETDFNLNNLISDDKQYGLPRYSFDGGTTVGEPSGNSLPDLIENDTSHIDQDSFELIYNANFDASDANNNYHYLFRFQLADNLSMSDKFANLYFVHPENPTESVNQYNNDVKVTVKQSSTPFLDAIVTSEDGQTLYPNITNQVWYMFPSSANSDGSGLTIPVTIFWNSETGANPTIGLWEQNSEGASTYTALSHTTATDSGLQYSDFVTNGDLSNVNGAYTSTILVSVSQNTTEDIRKTTLGFWHPTLDPASGNIAPTDTIIFNQSALEFDETTMGVQVFSVGSTDLNAASSGTITVNLAVLDYTSNDFVDNSNVPTVEVWRANNTDDVDNIGSAVYLEEGVIEQGAVNVSKNLSWTSALSTSENNYTHFVEIPYETWDSNNPYYIAVRAKHSLSDAFQSDDYIFYTLQSLDEGISITSAYLSSSTEEGQNTNIMTTQSGVNVVEVPGNFEGSFNFEISANNLPVGSYGNFDVTEEYGNEALTYLDLPHYIHARFINPNYIDSQNGNLDPVYAKIFNQSDVMGANAIGQSNLPPGLIHSGSEENSEYVIEYPDVKDDSQGSATNGNFVKNFTNPTTTEIELVDTDGNAITNANGSPIYEGTQSFDVELKIKPHGINFINSEYIIGLWTGSSKPKTSIINIGSQFIVPTASSAANTGIQNASNSQKGNIIRAKNSANLSNVANATVLGVTPEASGASNINTFVANNSNRINFVKNHLLVLDPDNNGFTWNYGAYNVYDFTVTTDADGTPVNNGQTIESVSTSYIMLDVGFLTRGESQSNADGSANDNYFFSKENISVNQDLLSHDYGNTEVIVEFEIYDYETNLPGGITRAFGMMNANNTAGRAWTAPSSNWFDDAISLPDQLQQVTSGIHGDYIYDNLLGVDNAGGGNGKYKARIKIKSGHSNDWYHNKLTFYIRPFARFKVRNFFITEVNTEITLDPTVDQVANNIPITSPDAYLYVKHLPDLSDIFSFNQSENGTPIIPNTYFQLNSSGDPIIVSPSNMGNITITASGTGSQDLAFQTINYASGYQVYGWNGSSSFALVSGQTGYDAANEDLTNFNAMISNLSISPAGVISFKVNENSTPSQREISIALYPGNPANNSATPNDTITITQLTQA
jgi:hypothetical protein